MDTRKFRRFFRRIRVVLCTENFEYGTKEGMFDRQDLFLKFNPATGLPMTGYGFDSSGSPFGVSYLCK